MFGQRSKQTQPLAGTSSQWTNPAFEGFRFAVSTKEYPCRHPHYAGLYVLFTFDRGGEIKVATPCYSGANSLRYALADLPANEWVQLMDPTSRLIPIEVLVDPLGALGRWLP